MSCDETVGSEQIVTFHHPHNNLEPINLRESKKVLEELKKHIRVYLKRKLDVQWLASSTKAMVLQLSPLSEHSLVDQYDSLLETSDFRQIWWERSKAVFKKIQLCLRPNF